jgi:hypothetical protein
MAICPASIAAVQLIYLGESHRAGSFFLFSHRMEVRHELLRVPEDLYGALHIVRQLGGNLNCLLPQIRIQPFIHIRLPCSP